MAGLLVVTAVVVGCTAVPPRPNGPAEHAPAPRWGPCPADVVEAGPGGASTRCGSVRVPVDHARPGGPTLDIAVSVLPATGPRRGALVVNPGGPGSGGLGYGVEKAAKMPAEVRAAYDIVGFDPRGTGRSAPVDCGAMGGLFDHPAPDPVPTDPSGERRFLERARAVAADCADGIGAFREHLGTMATARDLDLVRAALGEPRLTYLGVSYGSWLGAAYATLFPDKTGRMVLDSVVGPEDWTAFGRGQARAMLAARAVLFDHIADAPRLGLGATGAQVEASYLRLRAGLGAAPAGRIGPAEFDAIVYRTLSRTERWQPFADALAALGRGDGAPLAELLPSEDVEERRSQAANRATVCADAPPPSEDRTLADIRALRATGRAPVLTGLEAAVCSTWPPAREPVRFGAPGTPPVLLTHAGHDPTTPPAGARRMQQRLPGSPMVLAPQSRSHGVFASQRDACVDTTVALFLVHGVLPSADVACPPGTGSLPSG